MDLRSSTLAALSLLLISSRVYSKIASWLANPETQWYATVQVQVRDKDGHPIAGLERANFFINENGIADLVVSVETSKQLASTAPSQQPAVAGQRLSPFFALGPGAPSTTDSARPTTWVLLILAPMSAPGRNASITSIQRFLDQPHPADWSFALFDDAGQLQPFTDDINVLRLHLNTLQHHVSPPQFIGGPWASLASRAIAELGTRPGRRTIIFASDFEFDVAHPVARDRRLFRTGPSRFVDAAIRAQAAMYTVQASGQGVVVPFGGAADPGYNNDLGSRGTIDGQFIAERLNLEFISKTAEFGDFVWSAYQTGGRPARNIQDAFERIAEDAAGLYRVTFRPQMLEADGSWHPISVQVRSPRVQARYRTYYVSPTAENRQQVPPQIRAALNQGGVTSLLDAAAHV